MTGTAIVDSYDSYDAVGLAELVRRREVSPAELVDAAIGRIERLDGPINSVIHRLFDEARRQAAEPAGEGALAGVPFLLKDLNIQYRGQRTGNGSRAWSSHVAAHDSTITERYRAAGLIVLGFTNTAELGLACETAPAAHGPTRNPWDLTRSVGGSTGGAAAAVATRLVPAAHGTDGGGSIRIPSAHCGVFGLKPTRGRNPFGPDLGEGWNGLSAHHAITRTVRDSAVLLDVSHGPSPGDPYAAPAFTGRYAEVIERDPARLRVAFQTVRHDGSPIDPANAEAVRRTAALLERLGHEVEEARPEIDEALLKRSTRVIVASNLAHALHVRGVALGRPVREDEVEPITWLWAQEGARQEARALAAAVAAVHGLGRKLGAFFQKHDILLTSTTAQPPLPLGTVDMQSRDLDAFYEALRDHSAFTSIYNSTGVPAASVPLWWGEQGLPLGVQIAAPLGEDARVLQLAAQLERAEPWQDRRPPGV
ncbi:amidase [Roseococcus pinisoli]|uniref:Amidase n=1 Tax=Roseococcus pinisoli TaxID=2835040 RepID=A0ABS5QBF4_9PROT|nr:amidase [Roseococcus pinisoli]MBS7811021.1 amidase [Roseococcus pinisoli]